MRFQEGGGGVCLEKIKLDKIQNGRHAAIDDLYIAAAGSILHYCLNSYYNVNPQKEMIKVPLKSIPSILE